MAKTIANSDPLPFENLCDVLKPLLIGTGRYGRQAIERLQNKISKGLAHHIGVSRLTTPAGTLRISLANQNHARALFIALDISKTLGYVHGELHKTGVVLPKSVADSMIGQPLSVLCETPEGFPGADRTIENIRMFTRSTRIKIARQPATITLDEIYFPKPRGRSCR